MRTESFRGLPDPRRVLLLLVVWVVNRVVGRSTAFYLGLRTGKKKVDAFCGGTKGWHRKMCVQYLVCDQNH